ncbi:MAG TPA: hypothetical protein VL383_05310 [Gemmatimonadaceae bacterium]|nr:hypothetical protein [Gemmatimonadaceae bacterium]
MPRNKDLKRLVRARMTKTGESYTAARAQVIRKSQSKNPQPVAAAATADYAKLAGMSDEAIKAATGCTWKRWVGALDHYGAAELSHRDIAKLVGDKYKIGSWWRQTVAVGYERIKGLRDRGQKRDGSFGASKSRTFNVPVQTLYDAWANANLRKRWLDGASVKVRKATAPKTIRLDWRDQNGGVSGIVAVGFAAKGPGKSAVAIDHGKVPDRETANRLKQYWSARFDALGEMLAHSDA